MVDNVDPPLQVYDADVETMIETVIAFGLVPSNTDANMLYVVYLPKETTSHPDLERGWGSHYFAFSSSANNLPVYFATITPTVSLDTLTLLSSHEVDEAIADPDPRSTATTGWDEIGDPCQSLSSRGYRFNGYLLERSWSNTLCGCVSTVAKPFASRHDIVWSDNVTGDVGLWQMNGSSSVRTFGTIARSILLDWKIVGTGDFDGDGDGEGDLLRRNTQTRRVGVWLLHGESVTNWDGVPLMQSFFAQEVQGVGDFDGDGISDVLWRDPATGDVSIVLVGAKYDAPIFPPRIARARAGRLR